MSNKIKKIICIDTYCRSSIYKQFKDSFFASEVDIMIFHRSFKKPTLDSWSMTLKISTQLVAALHNEKCVLSSTLYSKNINL